MGADGDGTIYIGERHGKYQDFPANMTEDLRNEYLRRARELREAQERSFRLETDFFKGGVLNAHANEALDDYMHKRSEFGVWLVRHHEELFAQ